jgi:hypothetical protein
MEGQPMAKKKRITAVPSVMDILNSVTPEQEAFIQAFLDRMHASPSEDSFSQSEVDKGISYLDEEFGA